MRLSVDISGQVQQKNYDSVAGCKRSDGVYRTVYLRVRTKKAIIRKYKSQVTRLTEKIHCILIYYCIKDLLKGVKELKICRDINPRVLKRLLPLLFKDKLSKVKIILRKHEEPTSNGHRPALRTFRRRKYADEIIKKDMIEKLLFEFKE